MKVFDEERRDVYYAALFTQAVLERGIAQSGSAPALGAGCRGFESLCPDQNDQEKQMISSVLEVMRS